MAHPCAGNASFDVFCVKILAGVLVVGDLKNPKIAESTLAYSVREVVCLWKRNH